MKIIRQALFVWIVFSTSPASLFAAAPATSFHYKGFVVDELQVHGQAGLGELEAKIREQIDMVASVGVSKDLLDFFHSVPIKLINPSDHLLSEVGYYSVSEKEVEFSMSLIAIGHKPILIHELLHAFHMQRLPGDVHNSDVIRFYNQAKTLGIYSPDSHMMLNQWEFFACSGTTYLFGVTAQEPFVRGKLRMSQPDFCRYLKELFGPDTGTYAGSLVK